MYEQLISPALAWDRVQEQSMAPHFRVPWTEECPGAPRQWIHGNPMPSDSFPSSIHINHGGWATGM